MAGGICLPLLWTPTRVLTTRVGYFRSERTNRPVLGGYVPRAAMLEVGANFAEPLSVRSGLLVIGFNLLALRARVVVVVNVFLPGLLLGFGMKRRDFCHGHPLLLSSERRSLGLSRRMVLYGGGILARSAILWADSGLFGQRRFIRQSQRSRNR